MQANNEDAEKIKQILSKDKTTTIIKMETGFVSLAAYLIILSILLKHLEQLSENMNKGDTPFTLENVNHIKKMSYYMIACIILSGFGEGMFDSIISKEFTFGLEMFDIVEIIFLYVISYIFEYGYEIQKDSKGRMYGNE